MNNEEMSSYIEILFNVEKFSNFGMKQEYIVEYLENCIQTTRVRYSVEFSDYLREFMEDWKSWQ